MTQVQRLPSHQLPMARYNADLRVGLGSKLFFMDHLPVQEVGRFVDFGCADGALLKALHSAHPKVEYHGVDNDQAQVEAFRAALPDATYGYQLPLATTRSGEGSTVAIFSSVLHEVFTGRDHLGKRRWWDRVVEPMGYDFIVIRDFALPRKAFQQADFLRMLIGECATLDQWWRYRQAPVWDSLTSPFEFLLKYTYVDNWEREEQEQYLHMTAEGWRMFLTASGRYRVRSFNTTVTPKFLKDMRDDFKFTPQFTTHFEVVLERNTNAL